MCLDCSTPCKGQYCSSTVDVVCKDCGSEDQRLLRETFDYQKEVAACLEDKVGYELGSRTDGDRRIRYYIEPEASSCQSDYNCRMSGRSGGFKVYNSGFFGVVHPGNLQVNSTEDLRADVHETTHAYMYQYLGSIPSWFNEGVAIYFDDRLNCHIKQPDGSRLAGYESIYKRLKQDSLDIESFNNSHDIGSLFFLGLEKDYNCDKQCVLRILRDLHERRKACDSQCIEAQTGRNTNDTIANLGFRLVSTETIIRETQEATEEDISPLVELLRLRSREQ